MIEFNLLPDVKIDFIKAQRQKQLVIVASVIASGAAIALFLLLFAFVHGVQKKSIHDLTNDIHTQSTELINTPNLNKMLTVQNQLDQLNKLHGDKVVSSRLFGYLQKVTPTNVAISELKIDYTQNTMEIDGGAPSLAAVNNFAAALKNARYTTQDNKDQQAAFSDVVLSSFNVTVDKGPQYTFTLSYNPDLFSQTQDVNMVVQQNDTSRPDNTGAQSVFSQNGGQ